MRRLEIRMVPIRMRNITGGSIGHPVFLQIASRQRADERTRTAFLFQLRVMHQALQGCARACKCPIDKPISSSLAECCTVLRSQWYQSGVKPLEKLWSGVKFARPYALSSHSYCKIYLKR